MSEAEIVNAHEVRTDEEAKALGSMYKDMKVSAGDFVLNWWDPVHRTAVPRAEFLAKHEPHTSRPEEPIRIVRGAGIYRTKVAPEAPAAAAPGRKAAPSAAPTFPPGAIEGTEPSGH
jgi:hypothetical protein